MFRFLCFNSRVHNPKLKKPVEPPCEAMHEKVQEYSPSQPLVDSTTPSSLLTFSSNSGDRQTDNSLKNATDLVSVEPACNSEDMNLLSVGEVPRRASLKKSQSVGDGFADQETIAFADNITEYETDSNFVCDSSNYQNGLLASDEQRLTEMQQPYQISSYLTQNGCVFAAGNARHSPSEKDANESSRIHLSDEYPRGSSGHTTYGPTRIMRSHSLPIIGTFKSPSGKSYLGNTVTRSRSHGNLHAFDRRQDVAIFEFDGQAISKRNDCFIKSEKGQFDDALDGGSESHNYSGPTRDWIMPTMDDANVVKTGQDSIASRNEMPSKDFKIKRITDWVNDLELSGLLEEPCAFSESIDQVSRDTNTSVGLASAKLDDKISAGMEAAKKHISCLSPTATNVQLTNHGLVVIPYLVAFVSLKMLNLSGNGIVRITAGALPRGLHMLNLSKNNISTIEGLRELSRLRVLDLSYNRILRIGHGLASCSSLKELYLAGNKISEVEGLHRLLKLNILDLRFNKISTAKCLDQLAANYVSLQAISLEGNPAQKNVGDEHLKKYLQRLLPYLAYYNRLPVKANTLKDTADRTVGIGVSSHQFDRSLRSDHRASWKVGHGSSAHRPPASSSHVRRSNTAVSPKNPREKHDNLRQITSKAATGGHQHNNLNLGPQNLVIASDLSMRRSRSEGTLGAV